MMVHCLLQHNHRRLPIVQKAHCYAWIGPTLKGHIYFTKVISIIMPLATLANHKGPSVAQISILSGGEYSTRFFSFGTSIHESSSS